VPAARRRHAVRQHVRRYEALSDRMKVYLDGLIALHDGNPPIAGSTRTMAWRQAGYPRAEHPVVRPIR